MNFLRGELKLVLKHLEYVISELKEPQTPDNALMVLKEKQTQIVKFLRIENHGLQIDASSCIIGLEQVLEYFNFEKDLLEIFLSNVLCSSIMLQIGEGVKEMAKKLK